MMRPQLPPYPQIVPYLKVIDETRVYTNFGPLHQELESRLAKYFGVNEDEVLLLTNGTVALQGAVETSDFVHSEWVIPSWTFVASAAAVVSARRDICFGDVDLADWSICVNPQASAQPHLVVAPFGDSPTVERWRSQIPHAPLIIDAASCFDACREVGASDLTNTVVMVSLHATKLVTTGEGGVLVGDSAWINDVKRWSNFGFRGKRIADVQGTNAKMSEYAAAVGLASLDAWPRTREHLLESLATYQKVLQEIGVSVQPSLRRGLATSTVVAEFGTQRLRDAARRKCEENQIETRAWWSDGVHAMETFSHCRRREQLTSTDDLAARTLGLPFFVDIKETQIKQIAEVLAEAVA